MDDLDTTHDWGHVTTHNWLQGIGSTSTSRSKLPRVFGAPPWGDEIRWPKVLHERIWESIERRQDPLRLLIGPLDSEHQDDPSDVLGGTGRPGVRGEGIQGEGAGFTEETQEDEETEPEEEEDDAELRRDREEGA